MLKVGFSESTMFKEVRPRKFVQTRAEDKLVWTMPSAAEFGETQKIAQQFLLGDKTRTGVRSTPPLGAVKIAQQFLRVDKTMRNLRSRLVQAIAGDSHRRRQRAKREAEMPTPPLGAGFSQRLNPGDKTMNSARQEINQKRF